MKVKIVGKVDSQFSTRRLNSGKGFGTSIYYLLKLYTPSYRKTYREAHEQSKQLDSRLLLQVHKNMPKVPSGTAG
jgi:hypothetical protein